MKISPHIHCLRIDFQVTPELRRFVHVFFIIGEKIYLVDAGVAGSEKEISEYLTSQGRSVEEIDGLFLTHSHPDHIGGAAVIKRLSECKVYASDAERSWIEDIEQQFRDRPIPNFHTLLNESVQIDEFIRGGDIISCEDGISLEVLDTPGHSHGSQCFLFREERALFTGDAIPVPGDIPIYISPEQTETTLKKILSLDDIAFYLSAWDEVRNKESGRQALLLALDKQEKIDMAVRKAIRQYPDSSPDLQFREVCHLLNMEPLEQNPLFRKSVSVHLQEVQEKENKRPPLS